MFCECRTSLHEDERCDIYRCVTCHSYISRSQNHVAAPNGGFQHVACTRRPIATLATLDNNYSQMSVDPLSQAVSTVSAVVSTISTVSEIPSITSSARTHRELLSTPARKTHKRLRIK